MQGNDSRRAAWLAVLVVLLLLVAGGVAFLTLGGEDEAKAQTVRFQAPTDNGPDPFTAPAERRGAKVVKVGSGPFGGTGSDLVCDRELLIRSLVARPDRLREWARVLGVTPTTQVVASYIRKLRPVTLTARHARDQPLVRRRARGGVPVDPPGGHGGAGRQGRRAGRALPLRQPAAEADLHQGGRLLRLPAELRAAAALRVLRLRRPRLRPLRRRLLEAHLRAQRLRRRLLPALPGPAHGPRCATKAALSPATVEAGRGAAADQPGGVVLARRAAPSTTPTRSTRRASGRA